MKHEVTSRADFANRRVGEVLCKDPYFRLAREPFAKGAFVPPVFCANYSTHHAGQILAQVIENKGRRYLLSDTLFEGRKSLLGYHGAVMFPAKSSTSGSRN